jgi:hypothetical protein
MGTYKCELVYKDLVKERFFRDGDSVVDILAALKMFKWPAGVWRITNVTDCEDEQQ